MNIYLYMNTEQQTQIAYFIDVESNPFKIGDVLCLNVRETYPAELSHLESRFSTHIIKDENDMKEMFHLKRVEIVRDFKQINLSATKKPQIVIEYFCNIIPE